MPYISQERRAQFEHVTKEMEKLPPLTPGDLNYLISNLLIEYIGELGPSYTIINDAVGVLECAKLELYRRVAVDYEDQKAEENGDVY